MLVNLLSEGEVVGTLSPGFEAAADTDSPRFRGYEVPGSFHHWEVKPGACTASVPERRAGRSPPDASRTTTACTTTGRGTLWCTRSSITWIAGCVTTYRCRVRRASHATPRRPTASDATRTATRVEGCAHPGSTFPPCVLRAAVHLQPGHRLRDPADRCRAARRFADRGEFVAAWEHSIDTLTADGWLLDADADTLRADPR